ncbi:hypothetical protein ACU4GD_45900 [Cupriavidus basilensis]
MLSGVRPLRRIADSELDELVVTDTIPLHDAARSPASIRQLSTRHRCWRNDASPDLAG